MSKKQKRDIGAEILEGLREFKRHPEKLKRTTIEPLDVKAIRESLAMTQNDFARFLDISVRTLEKWEQGARKPAGAANTLLRIIQREPEAALRALHT